MDKNEQDLQRVIERVESWQGKAIEVQPIPGGFTNPNWKVVVDGKSYFVKIPGKGTDAFIDRENAHIAGVIASEEGIGPEMFAYFEDSGVEICEFLEGYRTLQFGDVFNPHIFKKIAATIRRFHQHSETELPVRKDPFEQTSEMMRLAQELGGYVPPEISRMRWLAQTIEESFRATEIEFVPCHVDHWTANYLFREESDDLRLTDFEYASMNDVGWDFASLSTTNYFTEAMDKEWIRTYYGVYDEVLFARFKLYKILSDINWTMWSSVQSVQAPVAGNDYHAWMGTKITRLRAAWHDPRLEYWLGLVKGESPFDLSVQGLPGRMADDASA